MLVVFVLVLVFGYAVALYNGLVRVRNEVKLAWSNIDVCLVQRHDELPKLVEVCKQYMQYEGRIPSSAWYRRERRWKPRAAVGMSAR